MTAVDLKIQSQCFTGHNNEELTDAIFTCNRASIPLILANGHINRQRPKRPEMNKSELTSGRYHDRNIDPTCRN